MRGFWSFIRANQYLLLFGVVLTYFSSFGQTFLISLYIPELGAAFDLSNTGLSSLYAVATMASAFTLPWLGRLVDTQPLKTFFLWSGWRLDAGLCRTVVCVSPWSGASRFFRPASVWSRINESYLYFHYGESLCKG
jgi:hypothetical protein